MLLLRAADIPEYVQDGVVDVGITGADLVAERAARVVELLRLGFGQCTLTAAVPVESPVSSLDQLDGCAVATSYPRLAARGLTAAGARVQLVDVTGSVEVAPRLGLADAIVDLVSTGSTLRTNGLRAIGALFASEAVLIGRRRDAHPDAARLATVLRSVLQGRRSRYVMMNAPTAALPAIEALMPGRLAPTVLPLSRDDAVAVHALVPAESIWSLLPQLESAGATSILVVPVERMLG